jgi:excisionase family DNA binding protein
MTTQPPPPLQCEPSILITIEQAAALLCYHRNKIQAMIRSGELKAVGYRRSRRIVRASLDRWVKQQSER